MRIRERHSCFVVHLTVPMEFGYFVNTTVEIRQEASMKLTKRITLLALLAIHVFAAQTDLALPSNPHNPSRGKEGVLEPQELEHRIESAWASVSHTLLTEGCASALDVLDGHLAQPLPEDQEEALQAARRVIAAAAGLDTHVLHSFKPLVGQEVTVALLSGRVQLRVVSVTAHKVHAEDIRRKGTTVIRVPVTFGVADLTPRERMMRMGTDRDPGVSLAKGLLAHKFKALEYARTYFGEVPRPLGPKLLAAMNEMLREEHEQKAEDVPAQQPAAKAAGAGGVPEQALRLLDEPGPFRAVFHTVIQQNPMIDVDREVQAYVDAENRLRRMDVISPELKTLKPFATLKDLRILHVGGVSFRQRDRSRPTAPVSDLAPLEALPLETLYIGQTSVKDLSPLEGMPLRALYAGGTQVEDVTPLRDLALEALDLQRTKVRDLSPLRGLPLQVLNVSGISKVFDFRVLSGLPLRDLNASSTHVRDITFLINMPVEQLDLSNTSVHDFRVLGSLPLRHLNLNSTQIRNTALLDGLQLASLHLRGTQVNTIHSLRGMPLTTLTLAGTLVRDFSPLANLPLTHLDIAGCQVDTITWATKLPLRSLNLAETAVSDLSPLNGKKLRYLNISGSEVRDLHLLKGFSVQHLCMRDLNVDITPLTQITLERLDLDHPERHLAVLHRIKGLERINGMTFPTLLERLRNQR